MAGCGRGEEIWCSDFRDVENHRTMSVAYGKGNGNGMD